MHPQDPCNRAATTRERFYASLFGPTVLLMAVLVVSCGPSPSATEPADRRTATLPDGARILCEVMIRPEDQARGMMHRDSLQPDRGMLFVHSQPGRYPYWMFNTRIPLDIIWLDAQRRVVEISADTPPCLKQSFQCPNYGGNHDSMFVLEMAGGSAARHKLKVGDAVAF